ALAHKVSLSDVLNMVSAFRSRDQQTPVVLMGYLNPVEMMGYETFARRASEAGVDGVLTVDMPPEEAGDLIAALGARNIDPIFLISPESTVSRFKIIAEKSQGFIYYVSLKGVTGVKVIDTDAVAAKVTELKSFTALPIGVGFGIKDAESAAAVASVADGVVVGSAIVKRVAANVKDPEKTIAEITSFLAGLRQAMDESGKNNRA
ncbi:MAG TPA: tryptophan synthase subunit alpha, partial [Gammaproteobacteria bacterium]|nr:tryptophan synthase subunit alpha [Gammaproteobacteria bacterium]